MTAIFDIGKTNKKCFLFDDSYEEVFKEYQRFEEIEDDEGFPCDDIQAIQDWMKRTFQTIMADPRFEVVAINFAAYGASFVHVDHDGGVVAPLYNYLKPFPEALLDRFYQSYGNQSDLAQVTASPQLGMLNSGMQLYWLKHTKPALFNRIHWSMHFPQYLSYLFSGMPISDYTSIGCHTNLWDFTQNEYHSWVYKEGIVRLLPPILPTNTSFLRLFDGKPVRVGMGIHDSSAALLPYILSESAPFLLISTGTWSISLNPFSDGLLTQEDLQNDCLNFLRIDGKPVKAARLFLGNEYKLQIEKLHQYFQKDYGHHRDITFDETIFEKQRHSDKKYFKFERIELPRKGPEKTDLSQFESFETAFHQLMIELVALQIAAAERAIGQTPIKKIYIDGGFADNDVYVSLLTRHFRGFEIVTTPSPLGSALGAAMVMNSDQNRSSNGPHTWRT